MRTFTAPVATPLLGLLVGLALVVLPASVAPVVSDSAQAAPKATYRAVMVFDKNWQQQFQSRLTWRLYERRDGKEKLVQEKSWRAGSGRPRKGGKDSCVRNTGWAPNGSYRVTWHRDYAGTIVKGGVFRMDDMACKNGTVRRELFLHTEQGAGNVQCRDGKGDQPCRWEVPKVNDYKSAGCLKMAPGDLAELGRLYTKHFAAGVRYGTGTVVLKVVD